MRSKRALLFLAAAAVAAAFAVLGLSAQTSAKAPAPAKARKPLVRLDLLQLAPPAPTPERRNIFVAGAPASAAIQAQDAEADAEGQSGEENPAIGGQGAAPGEDVAIQYVGYIHSPRGVIGLVLVEGTAQAVAQGEIIQPGYTATRVTDKEIEVTGPDGKARIYPLQGVEE